MAGERRPPDGRRGRRDAATSLLRRSAALPGNVHREARRRAQMALRARIPPGARRTFTFDAASMLFAGFYMGGILPFLMVIARDDLKASPTLLSLMVAAPFIGHLCALFWVRIMDGRLKTQFVVFGQLAARAIMTLMLFASNAWSFALVAGLSQMIGTVAMPAYASVVKTVYPDDSRGRIMSFTRVSLLAARVAATLLVGWLLRLGWKYHYVFPVIAALSLIGAFIYRRIGPYERERQPELATVEHASWWQQIKETAPIIGRNLGILREDRAFRWFAIAVFIYGFGNLLTVPIRPLIEVDQLHITKAQVAALFVTMQLVGLFSYFWWGRFVDRRSPLLGVVLAVILNGLMLVQYVLVGTVLPATPWLLLPGYGLMGFVMAGIDLSYFNTLIAFAGEGDVSRYQGLQSFLMGVRGLSAPLVGGLMSTLLLRHGYDVRWGFAVGLVFITVGCVLQTIIYRRSRRPERPAAEDKRPWRGK